MKRLVYYLYISDDFYENYFFKCNELCLKQYIDRFDCANFVISVDYIGDEDKIKKGYEFIKNVCRDSLINYDVHVIENDSNLREVKIFDLVIMPLIEIGANDYVFFAHNKGVFRFGNGDKKMHFSIMMWICFLYYYSFCNFEELENAFNNGKLFYGNNLTMLNEKFYLKIIEESGNKLLIDQTKFTSFAHYAGCFYWFNISKIKEEIEKQGISFYEKIKYTHFLEFFPMYFCANKIASYNDLMIMGSSKYNPYIMDYGTWIDYIKLIDTDTKCLPFMKNIILEINKEQQE